MNLEHFLFKKYYPQYNCVHFACEVWEYLGKNGLREALEGFLNGSIGKKTTNGNLKLLKPLDNPETPCIVLCQNGKRQAHVGIYYKGRVLHNTAQGVKFELIDLMKVNYKKMRFFTC